MLSRKCHTHCPLGLLLFVYLSSFYKLNSFLYTLCLFSTSCFLLTSNLVHLWLIMASPVSLKLVTLKLLYTA